jgi:hypothetical protein
MKNTTPRILIRAIIFSLIYGIVVTIAGLLLGWKTSTQFSDGYFWAGSIMIGLGFINYMGFRNQIEREWMLRGLKDPVDINEGFKIKTADTSHASEVLAFLGISGVQLLGMSALAILFENLF